MLHLIPDDTTMKQRMTKFMPNSVSFQRNYYEVLLFYS